jgi:hypothetical protein
VFSDINFLFVKQPEDPLAAVGAISEMPQYEPHINCLLQCNCYYVTQRYIKQQFLCNIARSRFHGRISVMKYDKRKGRWRRGRGRRPKVLPEMFLSFHNI